MGRLFLDSRSKVTIYDKRELVPGGLAVSVRGNVAGASIALRPFITGIAVRRTASAQLRKALDRSFHLTSFGEHAGDVVVSGIVIVGSQRNYSDGADDFYNAGEVTGFGKDSGDILGRYAKRIGVYREPSDPPPAREAAPAENGNGGGLAALFGGREDFSETALQSAQNIRLGALGFASGSAGAAGSKLVSGALGLASRGAASMANAYDKAHGVINNVASVPGRLVETVKVALGTSLPDAHAPVLAPKDLLVSSVQALNAFFHIVNAGASDVVTTVTTCGITMSGHVFGMSMKSLPDVGTGYSFDLSMKVTQFYDFTVAGSNAGYRHVHSPTESLMRGPSGTLVGTGKQMVFSALRRHGGDTIQKLLG